VAERERSYDEICLELAALTSTSRKLHASEERRRTWLLEQLERCTVKDRGVERVSELRAALMKREYPPEIDFEEAARGQH
jgi:hypothetical protein